MKSDFKLISVLLLLLTGATAARRELEARQPPHQSAKSNAGSSKSSAAYVSKEYGFRFDLPQDWRGFSVINEQWSGTSLDHAVPDQTGPQLRIRNPKYTSAEPYEDIPIMVFTQKQWQEVRKEILAVSAAPFPPAEIARNSKYVFATPPRFYYDFAHGYEEVLRILHNRPMHTFAPTGPSPSTELGKP
jgi:hypothetical protein